MDASDAKLAIKLQRASQSSERLGNLVESLLDVSRIATGRFALGLKQFDLVENAARHRRNAAARGRARRQRAVAETPSARSSARGTRCGSSRC